MMTISGTQKLQLITSSGADIDVHISYSDFRQIYMEELLVTEVSRETQTTSITTATTTDILDAPGSGITRAINKISVQNIDSSVSNSIYLVVDDLGTDYKITPTVPLSGKELYEYESANGWKRIDSTGVILVVSTGSPGSGWTDTTVTDADFTAADDTRYYLPAGVLTTNRVVDVSGITTKVAFVVAEDAFRFRLTFTGATVYDYGGAETTDGVMGRGTSVYEIIDGNLIRTQ